MKKMDFNVKFGYIRSEGKKMGIHMGIQKLFDVWTQKLRFFSSDLEVRRKPTGSNVRNWQL